MQPFHMALFALSAGCCWDCAVAGVSVPLFFIARCHFMALTCFHVSVHQGTDIWTISSFRLLWNNAAMNIHILSWHIFYIPTFLSCMVSVLKFLRQCFPKRQLYHFTFLWVKCELQSGHFQYLAVFVLFITAFYSCEWIMEHCCGLDFPCLVICAVGHILMGVLAVYVTSLA